MPSVRNSTIFSLLTADRGGWNTFESTFPHAHPKCWYGVCHIYDAAREAMMMQGFHG